MGTFRWSYKLQLLQLAEYIQSFIKLGKLINNLHLYHRTDFDVWKLEFVCPSSFTSHSISDTFAYDPLKLISTCAIGTQDAIITSAGAVQISPDTSIVPDDILLFLILLLIHGIALMTICFQLARETSIDIIGITMLFIAAVTMTFAIDTNIHFLRRSLFGMFYILLLQIICPRLSETGPSLNMNNASEFSQHSLISYRILHTNATSIL